MELLLTGELSVLTAQICEALSREYHLVLYGDVPAALENEPHLRKIWKKEDRQGTTLADLFRTYDFEGAVYFSSSLMRKPDWARENGALHELFELCGKNGVRRTVFVALDVERIRARDNSALADYEMLLREDTGRLCEYYAQRMNLTVLRVPFLYDQAELHYPLRQIMQITHNSSRLFFYFGPETLASFVSMRDFTRLLLRVLDSSTGGQYTVQAARPTTLQQIAGGLQGLKPGLQVVFGEEQVGLEIPRMDHHPQGDTVLLPHIDQQPDHGLRENFGWAAQDDLLEDLPALYAAYREETPEQKKTPAQRAKELIAQTGRTTLTRTAAVLALFVLLETAYHYTAASSELAFMDLRLVFVMLAASVYGLTAGLLAALMACLATGVEMLSGGVGWQILFYNLENWLPFAFYLVIGAGLGYMRDRTQGKLDHARSAQKVVEEKYVFIKGLYEDMLSEKRGLKQQLLGSHESFGKIYDVARKLDRDEPERIVTEMLTAMEKILDNHTIAVYMPDKNMVYARLTVCSRALNARQERSLRLDQLPEIANNLQEDAVWCNTAALSRYPDYCAPVYQNGAPVYLIFIYGVRFEQMSMYYVNQIKVLCGLAKNALLRALEFDRLRLAERSVEGTIFYNQDYFAQLLASHRQRAQAYEAGYTLCQVAMPGASLPQLGQAIAEQMRAQDAAGFYDGAPCILFARMTRDDFAAVQKRFATHGITLTLCQEKE